MENKTFKIIDKSGRSAKAYTFSKEHIEQFFDLLDEDWDDETLGDYLNTSYIGDIWENRELKIECIKITNK